MFLGSSSLMETGKIMNKNMSYRRLTLRAQERPPMKNRKRIMRDINRVVEFILSYHFR